MVLRRVGLTGASGMLGRHLLPALRSAGLEVVPVSRVSDANAGIGKWDLREWQSHDQLDRLFGDVEAIVHAGAVVPGGALDVTTEGFFSANVRAASNIGLWALDRGHAMVHVSGAIVYAHPEHAALGEDAELGWSGLGGTYGLSKLCAEDVLARLRKAGLRLAIIRPSSIYGSGLAAGRAVCRMLHSAQRGESIEIQPPADDRTDLVHASDVARAVTRALMLGAWDVFNVASGDLVTMEALARACVRVAGRGAVHVCPDAGGQRSAVTRFSLDTSRARALLEWKPRVELEVGLRMMLARTNDSGLEGTPEGTLR